MKKFLNKKIITLILGIAGLFFVGADIKQIDNIDMYLELASYFLIFFGFDDDVIILINKTIEKLNKLKNGLDK